MDTLEIQSDRTIAKTVVGRISAEGVVDGPAAKIDADATYTIESQINGRWYRWTGQKPTIDGDRAWFVLRDGTRIEAPTDVAEGTGIEPVRPEGLDALAPRCIPALPTLRKFYLSKGRHPMADQPSRTIKVRTGELLVVPGFWWAQRRRDGKLTIVKIAPFRFNDVDKFDVAYIGNDMTFDLDETVELYELLQLIPPPL